MIVILSLPRIQCAGASQNIRRNLMKNSISIALTLALYIISLLFLGGLIVFAGEPLYTEEEITALHYYYTPQATKNLLVVTPDRLYEEVEGLFITNGQYTFEVTPSYIDETWDDTDVVYADELRDAVSCSYIDNGVLKITLNCAYNVKLRELLFVNTTKSEYNVLNVNFSDTGEIELQKNLWDQVFFGITYFNKEPIITYAARTFRITSMDEYQPMPYVKYRYPETDVKSFETVGFPGGNVCTSESEYERIEKLSADGFTVYYGFADENGKEVIPCKYYNVTEFREGLFGGYTSYYDENDEYVGYICGFFDINGKLIIPCRPSSSFNNGIAAVIDEQRNNSINFIYKDGRTMLTTGGFFVQYLGEDIWKLGKNNIQDNKHPNENIYFRYTGNTPSAWAKDEVKQAIAQKIVPQEMQDLYKENITRAEFARVVVMVIANLKQVSAESLIDNGNQNMAFSDTNDRYVLCLASLGIVNGTGNNLFEPNSHIMREEAATMLQRTSYTIDNNATEHVSVKLAYEDANSISNWAVAPVAFVTNSGIMKGIGDNKFDPKGDYTREQSYLTFLRLVQVSAVGFKK